LAKDFHRLRIPVSLMAMPAHWLYFRTTMEDIGTCHHCLIVHMCRRFAVAMGACNAPAQMIGRDGIVVKIQMTY
jgi:hypothetical protein